MIETECAEIRDGERIVLFARNMTITGEDIKRLTGSSSAVIVPRGRTLMRGDSPPSGSPIKMARVGVFDPRNAQQPKLPVIAMIGVTSATPDTSYPGTILPISRVWTDKVSEPAMTSTGTGAGTAGTPQSVLTGLTLTTGDWLELWTRGANQVQLRSGSVTVADLQLGVPVADDTELVWWIELTQDADAVRLNRVSLYATEAASYFAAYRTHDARRVRCATEA